MYRCGGAISLNHCFCLGTYLGVRLVATRRMDKGRDPSSLQAWQTWRSIRKGFSEFHDLRVQFLNELVVRTPAERW